MKGLIIENEYDVPDEIRAFLKDNPKLFSHVEEQCFCQHRDLRELAEYIISADAIIVMSTFLYRAQLEEYVAALASGSLGKKRIYGWYVLRHLNDWNEKREDGSYSEACLFDAFPAFLARVKQLVMDGLVYSIEEDINLPQRRKGYNGSRFKRHPIHAVRVYYSQEKDEFYESDRSLEGGEQGNG